MDELTICLMQNLIEILPFIYVDTLILCMKTFSGADVKIMVIAAGLPSAIYNVINDDALTFLLRANRVELAPLKIKDVTFSYVTHFERNDITLNQAKQMAEETKGYPFMYQLIGYAIWEMAQGELLPKR